MKVYKVITADHRKDKEEKFFTSKNKALGYIIGILANEKYFAAIVRRTDNRWYDTSWCYDTEVIFDSKNWNKYEYVMNGGITTIRIEAVTVY